MSLKSQLSPIFQFSDKNFKITAKEPSFILELGYIYGFNDLWASRNELSEEANVSTASIVRTMKKLGYDGFTSFKYDLKKQYQLSNKEFPTFNSLEIVDKKIQDVVDKNEQEVRKTIEQLDSKTIEDAMQAIFGARKVFIFSRGLSEMIASEMEIKFHLLERTCEQYVDPNIIKTISHRLNEQDLAIIVSLNGHEISFEGEMFFPNDEFHFSLYAKTAKFTKTNQILSKEELDNILEHLKKEFILKNRVLDIIF